MVQASTKERRSVRRGPSVAPPEPYAPQLTFRAASRKAVGRLVVVKWLQLLTKSAPPVFVGAMASAAALRVLGGRSIDVVWAPVLVAVWAAAAAAWSWAKRPSAVQALALWDERSHREEEFVSGYCFELQARPELGERLHLARARARLAAELGSLRRDLPARFAPRAWVLPLAFVGLAGSGLFKTPPPAEDAPLSTDALARAAKACDSVAREAERLDALKGLTPEERRDAGKLESSLEETARKMRKLERETPRQVLEELERRAREAEKLAEAMDYDRHVLSPGMVAEFERHADTAGLAAALRGGALDRIAAEAEKLAERLKRNGLTIEERERIRKALDGALRAATESDRRSPLGRNLAEALKHLRGKRRLLAARQFSKMARHLNRAQQRRMTQRQLRRLAQSLRSTGQKILGRNLGSMRCLSGYACPQSVLSGKLVSLKAVRLGQLSPGGKPVRLLAGSWRPPGAGLRGGSCAMLGAGRVPVPGTPAGGCLGAGQIPVPGAGVGLTSSQGGLQAGFGSAPLGKTPTARLESSSTGVVDPILSGEGPMMARSIDARGPREQAARSARTLAAEFIKAEEEALSEEPLPLSRREQVLRYFTAVRRQIEREH